MIHLPMDRFHKIVESALKSVPEEFAPFIDQIPVIVEDEPPPDIHKKIGMDPRDELFGYYEGTPIGDKSVFSPMSMPDTIYVFRGPHLRACDTIQCVEHEIRVTVLHEIAHHFGIPEQRLHELGYG